VVEKGKVKDEAKILAQDSTDTNLSQLQEMVEDRADFHAAVHGVAKSRTLQSMGSQRVGHDF